MGGCEGERWVGLRGRNGWHGGGGADGREGRGWVARRGRG